MDERDIESLARPQARAGLPFRRLLRLYLDPFALLKNVTLEAPSSRTEALQYNQRRRRMLLVYARRWASIAVVCLSAIAPLAALVRANPLLWIALVALELGFCTGLCTSFFSIAAYVVLGLDS